MYKRAAKFILSKGLPNQGGQGKFSGKRAESTLNNLVRIGVSEKALKRYRHYLKLGKLPLHAASYVLEEFYPALMSRYVNAKKISNKHFHGFLCSLPQKAAILKEGTDKDNPESFQ